MDKLNHFFFFAKIVLVNWYALTDAKKHGLQEAHFGIFKYGGGKKLGYNKLQKNLREFPKASGYAVNVKFGSMSANDVYREQLRQRFYLTNDQVQVLDFSGNHAIGAEGGLAPAPSNLGLGDLPNLRSLNLNDTNLGNTGGSGNLNWLVGGGPNQEKSSKIKRKQKKTSDCQREVERNQTKSK